MSRSPRCDRPIKRVHRASQGFSLLELFIVVSLLGIFIGAVYESVIVGLRSVNAADDREQLRSQVASSLERFLREAALASDVDGADDDEFQFDTPTLSNVQYLYSSGTLTRDAASELQTTILQGITSFDFEYFDTAGTQLSTPVTGSAEDTIRVVQVTVTVTRDTETVSVASAAFLRNL